MIKRFDRAGNSYTPDKMLWEQREKGMLGRLPKNDTFRKITDNGKKLMLWRRLRDYKITDVCTVGDWLKRMNVYTWVPFTWEILDSDVSMPREYTAGFSIPAFHFDHAVRFLIAKMLTYDVDDVPFGVHPKFNLLRLEETPYLTKDKRGNRDCKLFWEKYNYGSTIRTPATPADFGSKGPDYEISYNDPARDGLQFIVDFAYKHGQDMGLVPADWEDLKLMQERAHEAEDKDCIEFFDYLAYIYTFDWIADSPEDFTPEVVARMSEEKIKTSYGYHGLGFNRIPEEPHEGAGAHLAENDNSERWMTLY